MNGLKHLWSASWARSKWAPHCWVLLGISKMAEVVRVKGLWYGKVSPHAEPHLGPFTSLETAMKKCEAFIKDREKVSG